MIDIIFEDNHLLILNKPAGLPTQPRPEEIGLNNDLESLGKNYIKKVKNKPGNVYLHAIHRLDAPVSGIVIFAKTEKALSRLQEALRLHNIKKSYLAIVQQSPSETQGTLIHYLKHGSKKALVFKEPHYEAKLAELSFEILKTENSNTLLRIDLKTGRYHQIRAQLAYIGSPILGDIKYGGAPLKEDGIALHHEKITLTHPVTNEQLIFTAPIPSLFSNLLNL